MNPEELRAAFLLEQQAGRWTPAAGDALHECKFERAGFRAYRLVAPDDKWSLTLSDFDMSDKDPKALLTVHAIGHDAAFADLDFEVFRKSIGINGGTNFNGAISSLDRTLGGGKDDWERRLNYLTAKARRDVQGRSNGTFSLSGPIVLSPEGDSWVFEGRVRAGRTMSLFGPGSAGKTTLADGLAVSLCSNQMILPHWRPTRKHRVAVLDWDEGKTEVEARLYAICNAYQVEIDGYYYKRMSRPLADIADELGRWVVDTGIEVVFVSPMGRAIRNSERDPSGPVEEVYEILREFNTTNILIDHVRGDSIGGGADREYGSVRKRDNARGSFSVYPKSEEPGARVVVLKNKKADALSPRLSDQGIRIEYDPPWPRLTKPVYDRIAFYEDDAGDHMAPAPAALGETQPQRMARILLEHGAMDAIRLCALSGFDAKRLRDIAREARSKGFHVRSEGGVYSIDPAPDDGE